MAWPFSVVGREIWSQAKIYMYIIICIYIYIYILHCIRILYINIGLIFLLLVMRNLSAVVMCLPVFFLD